MLESLTYISFSTENSTYPSSALGCPYTGSRITPLKKCTISSNVCCTTPLLIVMYESLMIPLSIPLPSICLFATSKGKTSDIDMLFVESLICPISCSCCEKFGSPSKPGKKTTPPEDKATSTGKDENLYIVPLRSTSARKQISVSRKSVTGYTRIIQSPVG